MKKICFLFATSILALSPLFTFAQLISNEIAQSKLENLNRKGKDSFIAIDKEANKIDNGDIITAAICYCDSLPGHSNHDPIYFNKRYGLKIKAGKELNPVFEYILPWENNTYLIKYFEYSKGKNLDESWLALLDRNLKVLKVYQGEGGFDEFFHVLKNGKYGLLDGYGDQYFPFIYDTISDPSAFDEVLNNDRETYGQSYAAKKNGRWGIISKTENVVIEFTYDYLSNLYHGRAIAMKNGKWGIIDAEDSAIVPLKFDSIVMCRDGYFVMKGKKWGMMNGDLEYLKIEFSFDEMVTNYFNFGRVGKKWFRTNEGKIENPNEYFDGFEKKDPDSGPFICLRKNGKIAVYDCYHGKFSTDYIYTKVIDILYERGQERDADGNLIVDYPIYRFKMIQNNKEVEFTINN